MKTKGTCNLKTLRHNQRNLGYSLKNLQTPQGKIDRRRQQDSELWFLLETCGRLLDKHGGQGWRYLISLSSSVNRI